MENPARKAKSRTKGKTCKRKPGPASKNQRKKRKTCAEQHKLKKNYRKRAKTEVFAIGVNWV